MNRSLIGLTLILSCCGAQAALQGRLPATPGGTDYQAYYDDTVNITWVADANLSQTSGYDADGVIGWPFVRAWLDSLNAAGYLGVRDWRLPGLSEMAYMYSQNLVTAGSPDPFANVMGDYMPGTQTWLPEYLWVFNFNSGSSRVICCGRFFGHAWAVRDGDFDGDEDGLADGVDNCTLTVNQDQLDADGDGYGNACDADFDNSGGIVNFADLALFRAAFGQPVALADLNGSGGIVNFEDLAIFRSLFGKAAGPSGLVP